MKLTLNEPVAFGTAMIAELEFRERVVAGDLRGIKLNELELTDNLLRVAGRLCGQPDPVMAALGFSDLVRVLEVVGGFFAAGLPIGSKPSP